MHCKNGPPLTEDDDFIGLFLENLSMGSSIHEDRSNTEAIPNTVLDILDNLNVSG